MPIKMVAKIITSSVVFISIGLTTLLYLFSSTQLVSAVGTVSAPTLTPSPAFNPKKPVIVITGNIGDYFAIQTKVDDVATNGYHWIGLPPYSTYPTITDLAYNPNAHKVSRGRIRPPEDVSHFNGTPEDIPISKLNYCNVFLSENVGTSCSSSPYDRSLSRSVKTIYRIAFSKNYVITSLTYPDDSIVPNVKIQFLDADSNTTPPFLVISDQRIEFSRKASSNEEGTDNIITIKGYKPDEQDILTSYHIAVTRDLLVDTSYSFSYITSSNQYLIYEATPEFSDPLSYIFFSSTTSSPPPTPLFDLLPDVISIDGNNYFAGKPFQLLRVTNEEVGVTYSYHLSPDSRTCEEELFLASDTTQIFPGSFHLTDATLKMCVRASRAGLHSYAFERFILDATPPTINDQIDAPDTHPHSVTDSFPVTISGASDQNKVRRITYSFSGDYR